jgi:hypothetical protein
MRVRVVGVYNLGPGKIDCGARRRLEANLAGVSGACDAGQTGPPLSLRFSGSFGALQWEMQAIELVRLKPKPMPLGSDQQLPRIA